MSAAQQTLTLSISIGVDKSGQLVAITNAPSMPEKKSATRDTAQSGVGLFPMLNAAMREVGETQRQLALAMDKCAAYVNQRMTGEKPWTMNEMYWLMDRYGFSHERLHEVFPPRRTA